MENKIITSEYQEATALHCKIMANAEIAAGALLEMCQGLKEMRDKKLYLQLDMPTFDTYCEEKVGIKARQAYTYISTYEKLGSTVLQLNASLGITKLELIAQLPAPDRANDLAEGTFEGMSVKEIKELVKKSKEQAEQLESLLDEKEEAQEQADEAEKKYFDLLTKSTAENLENKNKISQLNKRIKELENQPIEVAIAGPSPEDIDKAVADAVKEEKAKAKSKVNKQLEKLKAEKDEAQKAVETTEKEIAELKKKLQLADPAKSKAVMYFESLQNDYNNMLSAIDEMSTEDDKTKFCKAVKCAMETLINNLEVK